MGSRPPHARYIVETQEGKISISPEKTAQENEAAQSKPSIEQWEQQWRTVQEQVSADWPVGVSAVDVISEMWNARGEGFILKNESGPKN